MSNLSVKRHEETTPTTATEVLAPLRMMRRLLGWDPFQQMTPFLPAEEPGLTFSPAFEVKETKDAYEFHADIPGVSEDDVEITVTGNRLTISGSRQAETEDRTDRYFATERLYGSFVRTFTLPDGVDSDNVSAALSNGVLRVVVPKKPETQPKKIAVSSRETQSKKSLRQEASSAKSQTVSPQGVGQTEEEQARNEQH
jgi:HSP20 family protein